MTKILALTDSLAEGAGGLSHATLNLATSIARQWQNAEFFVFSQKDAFELGLPFDAPSNLHIKNINCYRNKIFPWSPRLMDAINTLNPDLIHLRGIWRQPSLVCLSWKKANIDRPLVVQTAGMLEPWALARNQLLKTFYYYMVEKNVLTCCDVIHATSQRECNTLMDLGFHSKNIELVEEGVYLPKQDDLKRSHMSSPRKLLFLSRLHPVKGIELLLEAWSLLRPRDWVCEIAGMGESKYVEHLKREVSRLHLEDVVSLVGPLSGSAKNQSLAEAHAFILPSFSESFGIAIAEAMSWGLPVVTTKATPWKIIQENDLGWYVEPSLNQLTKALFDLCQTPPEDLAVKGNKARNYIAMNYDWSVISQRMAQIYRSLIS